MAVEAEKANQGDECIVPISTLIQSSKPTTIDWSDRSEVDHVSCFHVVLTSIWRGKDGHIVTFERVVLAQFSRRGDADQYLAKLPPWILTENLYEMTHVEESSYRLRMSNFYYRK